MLQRQRRPLVQDSGDRHLLARLLGHGVGTYAYKIQIYEYDAESRTEVFYYETNVASVLVTTLTAPGTPGPMAGPTSSSSGAYTLSWGAAAGTVTRYDLYENSALAYSGLALSASLAGRGDGTYRYKVQACNAAGCSAFTAELVTTVLHLPTTPVSLTGPGSCGPDYTIAWTKASGSVDRYELQESPVGLIR